MEKRKKYSLDAKELLSKSELYELKAGGNPPTDLGDDSSVCNSSCIIICTTCISCTECKVVSTIF